MSVKTLTPIQLWQGYDPSCENLELNIISIAVVDGVTNINIAFTAMKHAGERCRVVGNVQYIDIGAKVPCVIALDEQEELMDYSDIINRGFAIVTCDYLGIKGTIYPLALQYAVQGKEGVHATALHGASETALYVRSKVIRRLITAVQSLPMLEDESIAIMGWGEDCENLWQVCAVDRRIKAAVPMLNSGWRECPRLGDNQDEERDCATRWNIGCSVQANAKHVQCDILMLLATNNSKYSYDRIIDTVNLIKDNAECRLIISPNLSEQIYSNMESVVRFLIAKLTNNAKLIDTPTVDFEVKDGLLTVDVHVDNVTSVVSEAFVNYAYGDTVSKYRSWRRKSIGVNMDGLGSCTIDVYDTEEEVHCFLSVKYANEIVLSSVPANVIPNTLGTVTEVIRPSRIAYEKKMGTSIFVPRTKGRMVSYGAVKLEIGAMDIAGVTANEGDLLTYQLVDTKKIDDDAILQIDIFASGRDNCVIGLIDNDGEEFNATIHISDSDEWHKIQLSTADFKTVEMQALKEWNAIKCMVIYDVKGLLLNNILWI